MTRMVDAPLLEAEALRVYDRYAREVVEALGFCPWAEGARQAGQVRTRVVPGSAPDLAQVLTHMDAIEGDSQALIGLLLFPELALGRIDFQRFAAQVRQADADRKPRGGTVLAMADFHPDANADFGSPERLVPFIRRTPDPTLQLVRRSILAEVRMTEGSGTSFVDPTALGASLSPVPQRPEPLAARVARSNLKTVESRGLDEVRALLESIHDDRHASYARLGLPPAVWTRRACEQG
jgi:hypothetical protein